MVGLGEADTAQFDTPTCTTYPSFLHFTPGRPSHGAQSYFQGPASHTTFDRAVHVFVATCAPNSYATMFDSDGTLTSYVDVLIIGAGPAGLLCPVALAQGGVNVKIINKRCALNS